jgi:hypothetical protein
LAAAREVKDPVNPADFEAFATDLSVPKSLNSRGASHSDITHGDARADTQKQAMRSG